jgi:hypothetical protein
MDAEMFQSRFLGSHMGAGFGPIQNNATEMGRNHVLAIWQRIKEFKFLPGENVANTIFFESIL